MLARRLLLDLATLALLTSPAVAQVTGFKLSKINGGVGIQPEPGGDFGFAVVSVGDLDGDGFEDLAVGEPRRDDGGYDRGAVWILFREAGGTVRKSVRLSQTSGGFGGTLDDADRFGFSLAAPGDLNGDGTTDLFVGAPANDGAGRPGSVWVVYLSTTGEALGQLELTDGSGGLAGAPAGFSTFGGALAPLEDVDGDGTADLAVGSTSYENDFGSIIHGNKIWILFLQPGGQGAVRDWQRIRKGEAGFDIPFSVSNEFGVSLASPGDLDGDGIPELVVGNPGYESPFQIDMNQGEAWVLFLSEVGTVDQQVRITPFDVYPGFSYLRFGDGLSVMDDEDQNGFPDLAVAMRSSQVLARVSLDATGDVVASQPFGAINLPVETTDRWGTSFAALTDGNGYGDFGMAIGAPGDDDGGLDRGAVWIANEGPGDGSPNADPGIVAAELFFGDGGVGGFNGSIQETSPRGDHRLANLGDVDGDGVEDLAWGVPYDNEGGDEHGAVFVVFMNADGTVKSETKISTAGGGLVANFGDRMRLGRSLGASGDRDGNGVPDLLVGAIDASVFPNLYGFFVFYLNADGTLAGERWIADGSSGFVAGPDYDSFFGTGLAALDDLDGDGNEEWAVGSPLEGPAIGGVYILFTNADESIASWTRFAPGDPFMPPDESGQRFGNGLASLADLNGDGKRELAIGSHRLDGFEEDSGGITIATLDAFGLPTNATFLKPSEAFFSQVGESLATLPDTDGDGVEGLVARGRFGMYLLDIGPGPVIEEQLFLRGAFNGLGADIGLEETAAPIDLEGDGTYELAFVDTGPLVDQVVIVRLERPTTTTLLGCPAIPSGSLSVVSGEANLGETLTLAIDNPVGTQAGPAVPILIFGSAPLACGTLTVPGWGMAAPGTPGDVLIQALVPVVYRTGAVWLGTGPVPISLPIPHDSSLVGGTAYLQGILWEPAASMGIEFALTEAVELEIGLPLPAADP